MPLNEMTSCALLELANIKDYDSPEACIMDAITENRFSWLSHSRVREEFNLLESAHIIFCSRSDSRAWSKRLNDGKVLAKFIKTNSLGHVTAAKPAKNMNHPRSRVLIHTFVWVPDRKALERFFKKNKNKKPS